MIGLTLWNINLNRVRVDDKVRLMMNKVPKLKIPIFYSTGLTFQKGFIK